MKIKTIEMSVKKFIKIQGNPLQRDTKQHALKAIKFHLSQPTVTHAKVAIARNGKAEWKLDGHTRAYLWEQGALEEPENLSVDVYSVDGQDEAIELYRTFDNSDAVETNQDKVSGALRYMGLHEYDSRFSRKSGMLSAVQAIHLLAKRPTRRREVLYLMKPFKKELKLLLGQEWNVNTSKILPGSPSCVISAFLITAKMYGSDILGFWDGYFTGLGSTNLKSGRCGSKAAIDWIRKVRADEAINGRHYHFINVEALIHAYHLHRTRKPVPKLSMIYKRNHNTSTLWQCADYLEEIGFPTDW